MVNSYLKQAASDVWRAAEQAYKEVREIQLLIDDTKRNMTNQAQNLRQQKQAAQSAAAHQRESAKARAVLLRQAQELENQAVRTEQEMSRRIDQLSRSVNLKENLKLGLESQARSLERQASNWAG